MPGIVLKFVLTGTLGGWNYSRSHLPDGKAEAHRERDEEREEERGGKPFAHITQPGGGAAGRISGMNLMFPKALVILTEPGNFSYSLPT